MGLLGAQLYLVENFKHSFDIERCASEGICSGLVGLITRLRSYVYYTQVMQAETLASAYRLWRRNWRGKGKEYTAGALVWQVGRLRNSVARLSNSPDVLDQ